MNKPINILLVIFYLTFNIILISVHPTEDTIIIQQGHYRLIDSMAVSPDGKYIASGDFDGNIILWDLEKKLKIYTFTGHTGYVSALCFSPDNKYIVSGERDMKIKVWDIANKKEVKKVKYYSATVNSLSFSNDGKYLICGSSDDKIHLWDFETGKKLREFKGHTDSVNTAIFSSDGKKIVSGGRDGIIRIWDTESGEEISQIKTSYKYIYYVKFLKNDKQIISCGNNNTITIWDINTKEIIKSIKEESYYADMIDISKDEKYLICTSDNNVNLWDIKNVKLIHSFKGHSDSVEELKFTPDGKKIISAGRDNTVKIWNIKSREMTASLGNIKFIRNIALSPDDKNLFLEHKDNSVIIWDLANSNISKNMKLPENSNKILSISQSFKYFITGYRNSVYSNLIIWNIDNMKKILDLSKNDYNITAACFSNNNKYLAFADIYKNEIIIYDMLSDNIIKKIDNKKNEISNITFSPDDNFLITGNNKGLIQKWNYQAKIKEFEIEAHNNGISSINFSPDEKTIITTGYDGVIKLWDISNGKLLSKITTGYIRNDNAVILPDNNGVISTSSSAKGLYLYSLEDNELIKNLDENTDYYSIIINKKSDKMITTNEKGEITFWDLKKMNKTVIIYTFKENEWIIKSANDNYYYSSEKGKKYINILKDNKLHKINDEHKKYNKKNKIKKYLYK